MTEAEPPGMEHGSLGTRLATSILRVAGHRMAQRGEVDADLVRPPCVKITAQKRMVLPLLNDRVPRARKPASRHDSHSLPFAGMPADRTFELAGVVFQAPSRGGEVGPSPRAVL